MRPLRRGVAAAGLGFVAWLGFEQSAAADWKIELEARGELMRRFNYSPYGGPGLLVDVGYSFDTYPIMVVPEIAVEGGFYPGSPFTGALRAVAGLHVGAALEVEPSIYVRGGYAQVFGRVENGPGGTFEAGLTIDKRLERSLTIGGSVGYQGFFVPQWAHGFAGGFHVGFWL